MKILKYLFFIVVGLLIIFIAIGFLKPTVNYGHEITVSKSVQEAWAVSKDESKFGLWLDGYKSIELISGEKDAVGSKYKVVVNPGEGQDDFEMIETLVSMKEFEHVELHFDSEMMDFDQTMFYSEVDGKTKVRTESAVSAKGMMMRSMFAMMGASFQSQEEKNIDALKRVIEENTTDYYPAPVEVESEVELSAE